MFVLLPLFTFVFLFLVFVRRNSARDWREPYIWASLSVGVGSVISIEVMSIFHALSPITIRYFWSMAGALSLILFIIKFSIPRISWKALRSWAWYEWLGLAFIGLILLGTLLDAVMAPPNNWDSMTYHLPRVMQWAAEGSVNHFATHIPRQIFQNPGAEFFILQLYLLSGDDRWFNLVQWFAFLGCIVVGSWVTCLLGVRRWGQIVTAVFIASIPMAILQATSTQNDLVLSFWVLACVGLGLSALHEFRLANVVLASVALGLAALTKASMFVLIPFLIWFAVRGLLRYRKVLLLALSIVLIICGPHYFRNWWLQDGKSLVNEEGMAVIIQKHDFLSTASNGLRQMASELRTLWGPANDFMVNSLREWHILSGVKIDDRAVFTDSINVINTAPLVMDEDFAGNTFHVLLIILLLGLIATVRPAKKVWIYLACVCCSSALFWVVLKWQPWITRLHLPAIILFAPLTGIIAERWRGVVIGCFSVLFIFAFWATVFNATRPLVGKFNVFGPKDLVAFAKNRYLIPYYYMTAMLLAKAGCKDVGLIENADSWEYPLWRVTHGSGIRFRHVDVKNVSAKLEDPEPPCAMVTIDQSPDPQIRMVKGVQFGRVWGADKIMAFYVKLNPTMLK